MKRIIFIILMICMFIAPAMSKGVVQDGLCKVFLDQGHGERYLFSVDMQRNNKSDGIAFQFYPHGSVEKIAWYTNGVMHGTYRSFEVDGYQRNVINYYHGQRIRINKQQ